MSTIATKPILITTASTTKSSTIVTISTTNSFTVVTTSTTKSTTITTAATTELPAIVKISTTESPTSVTTSTTELPTVVTIPTTELPTVVTILTNKLPTAITTLTIESPTVVTTSATKSTTVTTAATTEFPTVVTKSTTELHTVVTTSTTKSTTIITVITTESPTMVITSTTESTTVTTAVTTELSTVVTISATETTTIAITTATKMLSTEITTEITMDSTTSDKNINCIFPFAQTPSGNCVNTLIDFNNCGIIGNVCPINYTSCSNGLCSTAPSVQLTNPIPIFTAALNGSVDDRFYSIIVPFNITLYNTTTNIVQVTTNGVLCLENCSNNYTESILPTNAFSGSTALPYRDDLYIYANTSQGIYYQTKDNPPNRTLIFEYYCSHYQQPNEYYHFQVIFFENKPGIVQYIYYDISDRGSSCTVGVQSSSRGPFIQHSFHKNNSVINNMILTFDTNTGLYTNSSII